VFVESVEAAEAEFGCWEVLVVVDLVSEPLDEGCLDLGDFFGVYAMASCQCGLVPF